MGGNSTNERPEVCSEAGVSNSRTRADAPRGDLDGRLDALGPDHREVLELVFNRLVTRCEGGATTYGILNLATDPRDFEAEGIAELVDGIQYFAAENVRLKRENARLRAQLGAPAAIARPAVNFAFDMTDEEG